MTHNNTDELKDSFLAKGYTSLAAGEPNYNSFGLNYLYIDKKDSATGHNSIYVCYVPKAKSNRTSGTTLYKPDAASVAAGSLQGLVRAEAADFTNGYPAAAWTFASPMTSLFKCVP